MAYLTLVEENSLNTSQYENIQELEKVIAIDGEYFSEQGRLAIINFDNKTCTFIQTRIERIVHIDSI